MATEKTRIDKYLWAIRIFKSRSLATEACDKGRVKCNGNAVKASRAVVIGDEYEIRTETRKWFIKVIDIIENRVQYTEAIKHYIDMTPVEEKERIVFEAATFQTGKRLSKIGRPTKKNKRDIDRFFDQ